MAVKVTAEPEQVAPVWLELITTEGVQSTGALVYLISIKDICPKALLISTCISNVISVLPEKVNTAALL